MKLKDTSVTFKDIETRPLQVAAHSTHVLQRHKKCSEPGSGSCSEGSLYHNLHQGLSKHHPPFIHSFFFWGMTKGLQAWANAYKEFSLYNTRVINKPTSEGSITSLFRWTHSEILKKCILWLKMTQHIPVCRVYKKHVWKTGFLICRTPSSCHFAFFYTEQMALLWLDTDGVSVVISNIPPSVVFAPALTP